MAETDPASAQPPRQPFTLGGVARHAQATAGRMAAFALLFGLLSGAAFALCFARCVSPVLDQSVAALPEQGVIRHGELVWPPGREPLLGANSFLAISAAAEAAPSGSSVDFALHFAARELVAHSLLGSARVPYPRGWVIELNRRTIMPVWGAWSKPAILMILIGGALALPAAWMVLALPYSLVTLGIAAILSKELGFLGAWKMSIAAQWPGAVLMSFMLALYALSQISLVLLAGAFAAHFVLTIVYLFFAPILLPQAGANPFTPEPRRARSRSNPFGSEGA
jgi:hypothetical protein